MAEEVSQTTKNIVAKELYKIIHGYSNPDLAIAILYCIDNGVSSRQYVDFIHKRLEVEEKKYSVGRSTSLEILRAQEDLATAEGNETKALIDYEISRGGLEAAKGTILDAYNIQVEEDTT